MKNRLPFYVTGIMCAAAIAFIVWSLYLVTTVNAYLDKIAANAVLLGTVRELNDTYGSIMEEFARGDNDSAGHGSRLDSLMDAAKGYTRALREEQELHPDLHAEFVQLDSADTLLYHIRGEFPQAGERIEGKKTIIGVLKELRELNGSISVQTRAEQGKISVELVGLWQELSYLALTACVLVLLAAFMAYLYARDNRRRKQIQTELEIARDEAVSAARAKSEFLANMSHEIRTPMNGVIGMADLLAETSMNAEQNEFVETIRICSEHLLTVINNILDFSKIDSGRMEVEEQACDVRGIIENSFDLLGTLAAHKNLELFYSIDKNAPPVIYGDAGKLRQVLVNLVNNAIKFTERGEVLVELRLLHEKPNGLELEFAVKDTGIGIPQHKQEQIFREFMQADVSTNRKHGGTGLGLTISKRLAELMGGGLRVESSEGKGSTFYFRFRARRARLAELESAPVLAPVELGGRSVLIVDDNETNRRILSLQCRHFGMYPKAIGSSHLALEILRGKRRFDIALLDFDLPETDGIELAAQIHELPGRSGMPLILLSSVDTDTGSLHKAKDRFFAVIRKPLKQSVLFPAMARALHQAQPDKIARAPRGSVDFPIAEEYPFDILLAEDNHVNQRLAMRMLSRMGYEATLANNGEEVIQALEQRDFDIILMDVQMPEMDGLETTRYIRRAYTLRRPRIIALTANAMEDDRRKCIEAGMDDYLSKPVTLEALQNAIRRAGEAAPGRHAAAGDA